MKTYSNYEPRKIEAVGNGSYRYHYNIRQEDAPTMQGEEPRKHWVCEEVIVYAPISSNKLTQIVLTERFGTDYEQKLVNEFNAANLGIYTKDEAEKKRTAYADFLKERAVLKAMIDADCAELNIR